MGFGLDQRLWAYSDRALPIFDDVYRGMNLVEGTAWIVFAGLVLARFARFRHSWLEIVYATAFFTFAFTDYREAIVVQPWLILAKGINLVALIVLRRTVMTRYYPTSRVY